MDVDHQAQYELKWPGRWLAGTDRDAAFEIQRLLEHAESEYETAVACWAMFRPFTAQRARDLLEHPESKYEQRLNTVYARAFVYALDMIRKLLMVIGEYPNVTPKAKEAIAGYCADCKIKHIRDSIAHLEDRSRGLGRNRKDIPSLLLIIDSFHENRYCCTGADGQRYEIEVSERTLLTIQRQIQMVIDSFIWE